MICLKHPDQTHSLETKKVLAAGIVAVLLNGILPKEDPRVHGIAVPDPEGLDNGVDHGQEHESADEKDKSGM